jgi:hypothetical protein
MNSYESLVQVVIEYQEKIMGPLAWTEASKVNGIEINEKRIHITGKGKEILEAVVLQYETLFGLASVEACKDAVRPYLQNMKVDLPEILH